MKLTKVIHVYKSVFNIKNDIKCTNTMCTGSYKVFQTIAFFVGKFLKSILAYLYSTKYNEINKSHLDVQNHTSFKKWHK